MKRGELGRGAKSGGYVFSGLTVFEGWEGRGTYSPQTIPPVLCLVVGTTGYVTKRGELKQSKGNSPASILFCFPTAVAFRACH